MKTEKQTDRQTDA